MHALPSSVIDFFIALIEHVVQEMFLWRCETKLSLCNSRLKSLFAHQEGLKAKALYLAFPQRVFFAAYTESLSHLIALLSLSLIRDGKYWQVGLWCGKRNIVVDDMEWILKTGQKD